MSLLILTDENCAALKRAAQAAMPDVRSGHLSEALAAALGFSTHAALRAKVSSEPDLPPDVASSDTTRFAHRLAELGYAGSPLDLASLVRSTAIPDRPFVEFKAGDRASNDAHYHRCSRANRPMVTIERARTYSRLNWDCITVSPDREDYLFGDDDGRAFGRALLTQFQARARGAAGKPIFDGGAFVGWIEKLLPETARELAEDYFKALYLPLREPRGPKRRRAA